MLPVDSQNVTIPEEGNMIPRLHEIKIISSSRTRYAPHRQGQEATRAVDKRASELNREYIMKARATDQQYCGTAPGTTGPVETKLSRLGDVKGVVVGAFGEGSEDLHSLIHHLPNGQMAFGHLQGEGGWSTEGEKWADQDPGGGTGLDHFPPEKGPLSGWSESPSLTFVE